MLAFPDWTFFFQIIVFLGLWTFLRRFLFEPNFSVLRSREERSAGALKEASSVKAEAETLGEQYQSRLTEAKAGASQQFEALYRETEAQAQSIIDSARTESAQIIARMQEALQKEIEDARQTLEARVPDFSREIAHKLLGRSLT